MTNYELVRFIGVVLFLTPVGYLGRKAGLNWFEVVLVEGLILTGLIYLIIGVVKSNILGN
jgi:hypothetical protein